MSQLRLNAPLANKVKLEVKIASKLLCSEHVTGANPVAPLADGYTWRARRIRVSERKNSTKTSDSSLKVGLEINPSRETSVSYVCRNVRLSRKGQAGVTCARS